MAEIRSDGVAGCLRTPKGGSARQILLKVGFGEIKIRLLSPRECARLMGADDYLNKPFSIAELKARIRAVMRRIRPALADDLVKYSHYPDAHHAFARIDGIHFHTESAMRANDETVSFLKKYL